MTLHRITTARPELSCAGRLGGARQPTQQQLPASLRGHCAQLDRLADHVTSFAKMMTKRTGEQQLTGWLDRVEADDQPELRTFAAAPPGPGRGHRRAHPALQLRPHRRQRQPAQSNQTPNVGPRQPRPTPLSESSASSG